MKKSILNELENFQLTGQSRHPELVVGAKVDFLGAVQAQVDWGANDDPRPHLNEGQMYEISYVEVHSWHTKISLIGFDGLKFNSASFRVVSITK